MSWKPPLRVFVFLPLALLAAAASSPAGGAGRLSATRVAATQTLTVAAGADGSYENPKLPSIGKYPTNANIFETLDVFLSRYGEFVTLGAREPLRRG